MTNDDLVVLKREHGDGYHYVLVGPYDAMCTCPGFERWGHCWAADAAKEMRAMTREVATIPQYQPSIPPPDEMRSLDFLATKLIEDNRVALPDHFKTQGEVFAVLLRGWGLGVDSMTAVAHIAVVNGRTEPDAQLMVAICMTREPDLRFEVMAETADATTVRLTRPSKGFVKEFKYTDQMARDAGLIGKDVWVKYKLNMRQWKAITRLARVYCADLINGVRQTVVDWHGGDALPAPDGIAPLPPGTDVIDGDFQPANTDDDGTDSVSEPAPEAPPSSVEPPPLAEPVIDVALASDDQIATITDYYDAIRDRHGGESLVRFQDAARERWPYAAQDGGVFQARKLTASDADALVGLLKATLETRDGNPPSSSGLL